MTTLGARQPLSAFSVHYLDLQAQAGGERDEMAEQLARCRLRLLTFRERRHQDRCDR